MTTVTTRNDLYKKADDDFNALYLFLLPKNNPLKKVLGYLGAQYYNSEVDYINTVAEDFYEFLTTYLNYLLITGELSEQDKKDFENKRGPVAASEVKISKNDAVDNKLKRASTNDKKAFEAGIDELVKSFNDAVSQERVGYRQQYEAFFMAYVLLNNIAAPCPGCKLAMYHLLGALCNLFSLLIDDAKKEKEEDEEEEKGNLVPVLFSSEVLSVFPSILSRLHNNHSYKKNSYVFSVESPNGNGYIPAHNIPVSGLIDAVAAATNYMKQYKETKRAEREAAEAEQRRREAEKQAQIAAEKAKEAAAKDKKKAEAAAKRAQEEAEKARQKAEAQRQKATEEMVKNLEKDKELRDINAELNGTKLKKITQDENDESLTTYDIASIVTRLRSAVYGGRTKSYFDACASNIANLRQGTEFSKFKEIVLNSFDDNISNTIINVALCNIFSTSDTKLSDSFRKNLDNFVLEIQKERSALEIGTEKSSPNEKTSTGYGVNLSSLQYKNVDFNKPLDGYSSEIGEFVGLSLLALENYSPLSVIKQKQIVVLFMKNEKKSNQPYHKWILSNMCDSLADTLAEKGITGKENIARVNLFEELVAKYASEQINKNVKKEK